MTLWCHFYFTFIRLPRHVGEVFLLYNKEKKKGVLDMEYENKYASKGVGNAGLTTGIIGTALGVLNGGLNGLGATPAMNCGCSEDHFVNRYEMGQEQKIAELQSQIALRDANIYQDAKMLEMYKYVDGKFAGIEQQLCQQNVVNAQVAANLSCMQQTIATLQGLTKVVVPIDSVCPQPMAQYNSWTAPTAPATGA